MDRARPARRGRRPSPTPTAKRAEQIRATRGHILAAAHRLFVTRGYAGTTVEAIALRATVSPQTVYNVVGNKAAVLKTVYDTALVGDDEPVPMTERPLYRAMVTAPDAAGCLRLYARMGREMIERVGPLLEVVFVQGVGDPAVRSFTETIENERAVGTAGVARHLAAQYGLRPGVSEREAADLLWSLTSPELVDRLVRRRGWTLDHYEQWLAIAMLEAVHGTPTAARHRS